MKLIYFFIILLSSLVSESISFSQVTKFQRTYGTPGYERAEAQYTSDNGFIIAGTTDSFPAITTPNSRAFLMKTDSLGNVLWNKTYTKPNYTSDAARVLETMDGGYLFRVQFYFNGSFDHPCLIKTDSAGNTLWMKCGIGGNYTLQTQDSGYASFLGGTLTKLDKNGNILWRKVYPGSNGISSGQQTSDKGFILYTSTTPYASGDSTDSDLYLIKTDSLGTTQWSKTYGTSNGEEWQGWGYSNLIEQTFDGGYILTGNINFYGAGFNDMLVIKTDSGGNLQWAKTYGGSSEDEASSIRPVTGAIGYILTGVSRGVETPQNSMRTKLIRIDGNGNLMWSKMYGGVIANQWNSSDEAYYVENTLNGGFIFSGGTQSFGSGYYDIWLVKTDANGVSGCNEILDGVYITTPPLIVGTGGADTSIAIQITDSIVYIGTWQYDDSLLCSSVSVDIAEQVTDVQEEIIIYPNPTNGEFQVKSQKSKVKSLEIYNVYGEKVYGAPTRQLAGTNNSTLRDGGQIDISSQPSGVYFLHIKTEEGMAVKKIIVSR